MFRKMTNEEHKVWNETGDNFVFVPPLKNWVLQGDDENSVTVWSVSENCILHEKSWNVTTKSGYIIAYSMNGMGQTLEFPNEDDIFKIIQKATELINFIKLK